MPTYTIPIGTMIVRRISKKGIHGTGEAEEITTTKHAEFEFADILDHTEGVWMVKLPPSAKPWDSFYVSKGDLLRRCEQCGLPHTLLGQELCHSCRSNQVIQRNPNDCVMCHTAPSMDQSAYCGMCLIELKLQIKEQEQKQRDRKQLAKKREDSQNEFRLAVRDALTSGP